MRLNVSRSPRSALRMERMMNQKTKPINSVGVTEKSALAQKFSITMPLTYEPAENYSERKPTHNNQ